MSTVTMSKPTAGHSEEFEVCFVSTTAGLSDRVSYHWQPQDAEDVLQTIFLRLMRRSFLPMYVRTQRGISTGCGAPFVDTIRARRREVLTSDFTTLRADFTDASMRTTRSTGGSSKRLRN